MEDRTWAAQGTADRLYALLGERLREQGEGLPCTLPALRAYAASPKGEIDYPALSRLDNRAFLEACHLIAFDRAPAEEERLAWAREADSLPAPEFQRQFLRAFVRREDYARQRVRLHGGVCIECPDAARLGGMRLKTRLYAALKPAYAKLPAGVRQALRSALRKWFF